jgi:lysozyme
MKIKSFFIAVLLIIILVISYLFFALTPFNISKYTIRGLDISHHNDIYSWNLLSKGISFCIIKASEGSKTDDNKFNQNWEMAERMKLTRGAYHFFSPQIPAEKQFELFKRKVKLKEGDLPPVLDVEKANTNMNEVNKWLQLAEKHYGVKPIIYSDYVYFMTFMKGKVDHYPLWLVFNYKYKVIPHFFNNECVFLQYNQAGKVNGINGDVDLDVFLGDQQKFNQLRIKK